MTDQEMKALYEADMKQWFTDNPGEDALCVDAWKLGFAHSLPSSTVAEQDQIGPVKAYCRTCKRSDSMRVALE